MYGKEPSQGTGVQQWTVPVNLPYLTLQPLDTQNLSVTSSHLRLPRKELVTNLIPECILPKIYNYL